MFNTCPCIMTHHGMDAREGAGDEGESVGAKAKLMKIMTRQAHGMPRSTCHSTCRTHRRRHQPRSPAVGLPRCLPTGAARLGPDPSMARAAAGFTGAGAGPAPTPTGGAPQRRPGCGRLSRLKRRGCCSPDGEAAGRSCGEAELG